MEGHPKGKLILAMMIWGSLGVFVRAIPLTSPQLALCRAVMAALVVGGYLLALRRKMTLPPGRELFLLLLSGACIGVNWILLFEAYRYTTVSVATLSYYFAPVLVTAACPVFFRETITGRQVLCFGMSTAGVALILATGGLAGTGTDGIGVLYGLGAAVLYASVVLLNKAIRQVAGIQRTFFQFLAALVVLLPYVLGTGGISFRGMTGAGWLSLLVVGVVHTGAAYCLYFSALGKLPGQEAALLSYLDPLTAVLLSLLVLGEGITPLQAVGGGLILGFALWNEKLSRDREGKEISRAESCCGGERE